MSKVLIIPAHTDISQSTVNKYWTTAIKQHLDSFIVHELYTVYPRGKIDVSAEQKLMKSPDAPVLQFPVYRFNCPPLLKQCLDIWPGIRLKRQGSYRQKACACRFARCSG